ncbi:MAG TPA: S8 family serine peptidase [Candidatus Krumholzibacteria bacterium]|nr:S8 family serine peptidase [Candidatus Krumholzibacteria bacterium]HPD72495.1 S8 family serine peptidase [Candidatus Krumholzibacteria bacterium]HRY40573.1 S8 family serine peptidase [Candidatus Krumholzibacteria bacterium]
MSTLRSLSLAAVAALLLTSCGGSQPPVADAPPAQATTPPAPARTVVTSLDQLPQHTYPVAGSATALLQDDAAFAEFAGQVRADLEADLARYQIEDAATLQGWYGTLASLAMLDGRWSEAVGYLDQVTALETKEAARLVGGQVGRALAAAHAQVGVGADPAELRAEFKRQFALRIDGLPWDVVQDAVERNKAQAEYLSPNLLLGIAQTNFDPVVAQSGQLGSDLARNLVNLKSSLDVVLPVKDEIAGVYADYIAANRVEKRNIWPEREIALAAGEPLAPVMIGIWDSGVDTDAFAGRVFTNPAERRDGVDDDGNGFVDDVHGIAFDVDGVYSADLLHPFGDQAGLVEDSRASMQGFQDLQANLDTPAAAAVRDKLSSIPPAQVEAFLTGLNFYGLYAHGTHVAGIALAGNPFAKVLTARITFDYHNPPQAMTLETARNHAESYRRTAQYFTTHGVRVVNMSWGWTFKEIEASLEANGVGQDATERAAMAREMLGVLREGLHEAMASTPQILYCVAAGNSDADVEFEVSIPADFDLPNQIVVGAVDQAGDPTDFTSSGRNVVVYANGFEVTSTIPGGDSMSMSGTSMASPQVCNLAGKLLAVAPDLAPPDLIRLIETGADPHPEHPELRLLNPRRSVELARAQ